MRTKTKVLCIIILQVLMINCASSRNNKPQKNIFSFIPITDTVTVDTIIFKLYKNGYISINKEQTEFVSPTVVPQNSHLYKKSYTKFSDDTKQSAKLYIVLNQEEKIIGQLLLCSDGSSAYIYKK